MALDPRQATAIQKALKVNGAAKVQRIEYGTYLVPSSSREGITHVVTAKGNEYECDCEAGSLGFPCHHKAAVLIAKTEKMSGARVIGPAPKVAAGPSAPAAAHTPKRATTLRRVELV